MALAINNLQRLICHYKESKNIHSAILLRFLCSHILLRNYFSYIAHSCWFAILYSPFICGLIFFFVILECPVLFVMVDPVSLSFKHPTFINIFLLIYSWFIVGLVSCFVFVFSSHHISICFFFLKSFVCCHNVYILDENLWLFWNLIRHTCIRIDVIIYIYIYIYIYI